MDSKYPTAWVQTEDVKIGDRIVCLLSDAAAYPTVEGWEDGAYKVTDGEYRDFRVSGDVPWWVTSEITRFLRSSRPGETLIVAR